MSHSDAATDRTAEASSGAGAESGPGGRTRLGDRSVARIGYGAMQLERLRQDRSTGVALLRRAIELGIDHIDTAQFYGNGLANEPTRAGLTASADLRIVSEVGA